MKQIKYKYIHKIQKFGPLGTTWGNLGPLGPYGTMGPGPSQGQAMAKPGPSRGQAGALNQGQARARAPSQGQAGAKLAKPSETRHSLNPAFNYPRFLSGSNRYNEGI